MYSEFLFPYPVNFNVTQIGHLARRLVRDGGWTRIGAVFENSFYVETPESWVCVAGPSTPMGPLALRCDPPVQMNWRRNGVRAGMAAYLGETAIYLNPLFRFYFSEASTWTPSVVEHWTPESLQQGLDHLSLWMQKNYRLDDGLGCTIPALSDEMSVEAERAIEPIGHLRRWLSTTIPGHDNPTEPPSSTVEKLIGFGPGLTPSGDDFLGGAVIALHLLGYPAVARQLFDSISASQVSSSNSISVSHLSAAATGSCNAWLHAALNAILAGDLEALPPTLKNIDRVGHSSGWDTLAGAVMVLTVWSELGIQYSSGGFTRPAIQPSASYTA